MPTKYPKGSYIVRDGERRKVLEELGDLRFLSWDRQENLNWETMASMTQKTVFELEYDGWKVEEDAKAPKPWKPKPGGMFYRVDNCGQVTPDTFHDVLEDFFIAGNCYRTREEAEKAAERVRKAYRG